VDNIKLGLYIGWVHPVAHVTMNEYPSTIVVILKNYWHRFNGSVRILNDSLHLVFCIR
jgi:hypothetical protein